MNDTLLNLVPKSHRRMLAPWDEKPGTETCTKCDLRKNACQLSVGGLGTIMEAGWLIAGIFLCCAGTHFDFPYTTDCFVFKTASQALETQNVYVCMTLLIDLAPVTKFHPGIVVATNVSCRQLGGPTAGMLLITSLVILLSRMVCNSDRTALAPFA